MSSQTEKTVTDAVADPAALARDIEQLSELATLVASARDAMSDEIVTRVSSALSEGITLLDRLTRNEGLMRLLQVLDRPESQYLLCSLSDAINQMSRELATAPPAKGGLMGLLKLATQPGTQEGLRAVSMLGEFWNESLRDMHRRGGF
ncbi:MAG: hypothetical protein LJE84_09255 [Gammaproteobacteria bacterium]|nr:hypothetical protein [Gammaproteobacteria bacterium]